MTNASAKIPVIELNNVTRDFRKLRAVDDISLEFYRGDFTALLGPNGAGKTTLIEMIEGIQKPSSGRINILGRTWQKDEDSLRKLLGVALQETRFTDKLTVGETLRLFAGFYGIKPGPAMEKLKLVNLEDKEDSFVVTLSGGQKQKLVLAIALVNEPEILLLDEPTTGLDPNARREIWNILRELKNQGTTLILTTHYMEEAERLCDRILIMNKGRLLAQGSLKQLLEENGGGDIIEFTTDRNDLSPLKDIKGLIRLESEPEFSICRLVVEKNEDSLPHLLERAAAENISINNLLCRRMTLDDLFTNMTGNHLNE